MIHLPIDRRCLAAAVVLVVAGCGPAEQVRTYTAPKEAPPPTAAVETPAEVGEPVDRMLTAIVPEGGQAWFYKVVGPIPAVDAHEEEILKFVAGVPESNGAATPAWTLPEGWISRPGSDGVTLATIHIPAEGNPLELAVTNLGWSSAPDNLLMNVNRWRAQMGLRPRTSAAALSEDIREMKAGEKTITIVDLRGRFQRSRMMPPFAGGAMGGGTAPAAAPGGGGPSGLPVDHPPMSGRAMPVDADHGAAPGAGAQAAAPKFDAPEAWSAMPAGGMNRAVFQVTSGADQALVTVSNIPAASGAMFADLVQNANLWRGALGMPPVTAETLKDSSESIEIGGHAATLVRAIPEGDGREATLAAIVTQGGQIWYFKIKGAKQIVVNRQDEFKTFLKSVQFAE